MATFCACLLISYAVAIGAEQRRPSLDKDFERFVAEKRELAQQLGKLHAVSVPPLIWKFFDAVQSNNWQAASNAFYKIEPGTGRHGGRAWVPLTLWGPIHDTFGAYEVVNSWNIGLVHRFGNAIIRTIPPGSLYFGGTDAGRFVVSFLSESHSQGRPFFAITQNALADGAYLDYLRDMYGTNLWIPAIEDSQRAFQDYLFDVQVRTANNRLLEGESVKIVNGRAQVSGLISVMKINETLARMIVENNSSREVYLEESFPMQDLYGQSLPHGLIFQVKHQPLNEIPLLAIETDRKFWTDQCQELLGGPVKQDTSVRNLCSWSELVFLHPESKRFEGNRDYVKDAQAPQYYSQCRSAIAGYYHWWAKKLGGSATELLERESDYAHRQAIALSPFNPVVIVRYTDFLLENRRTNDAKILIQTSLRIGPEKHMEVDSEILKAALEKLRLQSKQLLSLGQ